MHRTSWRARALTRPVAHSLALVVLAPALVLGAEGTALGGGVGDLLGGDLCVPLPGVEDCDTTAPQTRIDGIDPTPVDGTVTADRVRISFSGTDERQDAELTYECRLVSPTVADPAWSPCEAASGAAYDVADAPGGSYRFEVRASDDAVSTPGQPTPNTDATPASTTFGVDTTPPETRRFSRPPAFHTSRSATFLHGSSEAGTGYRCELDGRPIVCEEDFLRLDGVRSGRHRLSVAAVDRVGNVDPTPVRTTWRVPRAVIGTAAQRARWRDVRRPGAFDGDLQTTKRRGPPCR